MSKKGVTPVYKENKQELRLILNTLPFPYHQVDIMGTKFKDFITTAIEETPQQSELL